MLALRDPAGGAHRREHVVTATPRLALARERIVVRRRLGQARDQRRLGQRQVSSRLREVRLRRRLDSVGAVAVVDLVHVRLEDLVLRPAPVQLPREAGLLDLPLQRPLRAHRLVEVPDELLGDRRATLHDLPLREVRPRGPRDPLPVDPPVLVEAPILDRHRRAGQPRRHLAEVERLAVVLRGNRPEEAPVGRVDERVLPDRDFLQGGQLSIVAERGGGRERAGCDRRGPAEHDRGDSQRSDPPAAAATLPARATPPAPGKPGPIRAVVPRAVISVAGGPWSHGSNRASCMIALAAAPRQRRS